MISFPALSITNLLILCITFLILNFIYRYILTPYLHMLHYIRQGAASMFHWKLLAYFDNFRNGAQKGDFYLSYKETLRKNPNARMIVENFGSTAYIALVDLEMVKEVWKRHEIYQKHKYPFKLMIELAGGTTIFAEGAEWKKGRKVISSAFNYEFLKHVVPMIVETTEEKFMEWEKNNKLVNMNLLESLADITGEITGRFFFGKRFENQMIRGVPVTTAAHRLMNTLFGEALSLSQLLFGTAIVKANILPRHRELNKDLVVMRAKCKEMIEETEKSQKQENNLLGLLLELRKSENEEDRLTDEQIIGEFVGLFGAGTDTTSHLVNSALYFLWKYPQVLEKVREEADKVFEEGDEPNIESINKMEYTTAFLKETLRLAGPITAYFFRMSLKDDELCGIKVKKGTMFNFHPDIYYSNEKYFPNPKEFVPERWMPGHPLNNDVVKNEPYAFIPFSAGPRNCVGQHLALIEARIIVGMFIRRFKFSFPENYQLKMVKRFLNEPYEPLKITLTPVSKTKKN